MRTQPCVNSLAYDVAIVDVNAAAYNLRLIVVTIDCSSNNTIQHLLRDSECCVKWSSQCNDFAKHGVSMHFNKDIAAFPLPRICTAHGKRYWKLYHT